MIDPCPSEECLAGVLVGEPLAPSVLEHVDGCDVCRGTLVDLARSGSVASANTNARTTALPEVPIGTSLGRYVVVERIGAGGMGVVYGAYDPELDRKVAVKLLRPRAGARSLVEEAAVLAKVTHPGVVAVHDAGTADGLAYLVMELVKGRSLRAWSNGVARSADDLRDVLASAAAGLDAAHQAGLVHRDVKPDNILVDATNRSKMTDFGLALALGAHDEPHSVAGTLAYMAPEQLRGEKADARSDQYAFALTMLEVLAGKRPIPIEDRRARLAALEAGIEVPPALDRDVRAALARALSFDPASRFPRMTDFWTALSAERSRRHTLSTRLAIGASIGVAATAVLGLLFVSRREESAFCTNAEESLHGAWSAERRATVGAAFERSGKTYAETSRATTLAALDAYSTRWLRTWTDACRATRVRGERSEKTLDQRMTCLEESRAALGAFATELQSQPAAVERAVAAVSRLPPPEACLSPSTARVEPAGPRADRAKSERLARELAELGARVDLGAYAASREALTTIVDEARSVDDSALAARAGLRAAEAAILANDVPRSKALLLDAVLEGERCGDPNLTAQAYLALARIHAGPLSQTAEAEQDYAHAEALGAVAASADLDAKRLLVRAELYRKTSRFAEGAVAAKAALDELERRGRGNSLEAATAHFGMAIAASVSGDATASSRHIERAVAIRTSLLGARHPEVVEAYMNLAIIEARRGELASARARAMQALDAVGPAPSPDLALVLTNLAIFEDGLGEHEASLAHCERAADIDRMVLGDHPSTALALTNLADGERAAGKTADAARHYDEAELRLRRSGATDARVTAVIAYGRGQLAPEGSQLAVHELGAALELLDSKRLEPQLRTEVRFALARALAKKNPSRALAEATRAASEAKDLHASTADMETFVSDLRKKIAR